MSSLQKHSLDCQVCRLHAGETRDVVWLNEAAIDWHAVQEAGSILRIHVLYFPASVCGASSLPMVSAAQCKAQITVDQTGVGCKTEIYGLAWLRGNEQAVIETRVNHQVGGGESKQLIKFVLDDSAKGECYGALKIAPDARLTEAHQTNRNLLLSTDATMRTRPQLEIYNDDVKATHGAGTGQLDESALFYMQQRGIGEEKARQLLISAFMKDVVETIRDEGLREQLMQAIDGVVE